MQLSPKPPNSKDSFTVDLAEPGITGENMIESNSPRIRIKVQLPNSSSFTRKVAQNVYVYVCAHGSV